MRTAYVFSVTISQLIANAITSSADMCSDFSDCTDDAAAAEVSWHVTKGVVDDLMSFNRNKIATHFSDGYTMLMLPTEVMEEIENLKRRVKFIIEISVPGTTIPLVIHSSEVKW